MSKNLVVCKSCEKTGYLVMNFVVVDEVCEYCGTWQEGVYNDVYQRVG